MTDPHRPIDQPLADALAAQEIDLGDWVGEGATAVVYRALDRKHDRSLAVKVLREAVATDFGAARFANEIKVVGRLRHPGILPLIDSGQTTDGRVYYLMPFAEGETLRARLVRGPVPEDEAIRIAGEVADALAFAHQAGYVHRDIKPDNILIEAGRAVLADFGLARRITVGAADTGQQTQPGFAVGTPAYMSPEQLAGDARLDGRSDVYALGIVLCEMVTGRRPFEGRDTLALMAARFDPTVSLATVLAPVPDRLRPILESMLTLEPAGRPTAAELVVALRTLEQSGGAAVPRPARSPWVVAGAGLVVLLLAAALWRAAAEPPGLDPHRVLVADFANETTNPALDRVGPIAGDWISEALARKPQLTILNGAFILGAPRRTLGQGVPATSISRLRVVADSSGAGTVVTGSVYGTPERIELFAELLDARTGRLLGAVGPLTGRIGAIDSLMTALRDQITPLTTSKIP